MDAASIPRPWEGLASEIMRRFQQTGSEGMQEHYRAYMSEQPCPQCHGAKLRPESLAVTVGGMSINDTCALTIDQTYAWACTLSGETDRLVRTVRPQRYRWHRGSASNS